MADASSLGLGEVVLGLVAGLVMLTVPTWLQRRGHRTHEAAIADRLARGEDAYFEELRELRAYPPQRHSSWVWRASGLALASLSLFMLYLRFTD
jgi:hypothetical protein